MVGLDGYSNSIIVHMIISIIDFRQLPQVRLTDFENGLIDYHRFLISKLLANLSLLR